MSFKHLDEIIGKRIEHIVVKESERSPRTRFFLVFDDGDAYELWSQFGDLAGSGMDGRSGLGGVLRYGAPAPIIEQHPAPLPLPASGLSAALLNEVWDIRAADALFHDEGTSFRRLTAFPEALCDVNGYVLFRSQREYMNTPGVRVTEQTDVPGGIRSLPTYRRIRLAK
jgi:hypothetical protein